MILPLLLLNIKWQTSFIFPFLNDKLSIKKLKQKKTHLPSPKALLFAKENNLLPSIDELNNYVDFQKSLYQEDDDIKALTDKVMASLGIDKDAFFDTVVFNNGIFNLVDANLGNYYLIKKGKAPIFGLPENTEALMTSTPSLPQGQDEKIDNALLKEAKAFVESFDN